MKLAQAKYLLSRLSKFRTLVADKFGSKPLVLLSGDFNSVPGDKVFARSSCLFHFHFLLIKNQLCMRSSVQDIACLFDILMTCLIVKRLP